MDDQNIEGHREAQTDKHAINEDRVKGRAVRKQKHHTTKIAGTKNKGYGCQSAVTLGMTRAGLQRRRKYRSSRP